MKLTILNSNSRGNCYILQNDTEALVIECGVCFSEVKKALNFNVSKIVAALVSHEHGDHAKAVSDALNACVPVYASQGTFNALGVDGNRYAKPIEAKQTVQVGNFRIKAFDVKHDCVEPLGFLIHHPETGTILFATDTYYLPYMFDNLSHIFIECNYSKDILDENYHEGRIIAKVRNRVLQSHMSLETCKSALTANNLISVQNIILLHLSSQNSDEKRFLSEVKATTGKRVFVAKKGLEIELNNKPF